MNRFHFGAGCALAGLLLCLLSPVSTTTYELRGVQGALDATSLTTSKYRGCPSALPLFADRPSLFGSGPELAGIASDQHRSAACNAEKVDRWRKAFLFTLAAAAMLFAATRRRTAPTSAVDGAASRAAVGPAPK